MTKKITEQNEYFVTARIYENDSLNPKWYIRRKTFLRILNIWEKLRDIVMPYSFSGKQGYKGLTVSYRDRQVVCNNDNVTMYYNNIIEAKLDTGMIIENAVLKDAPENILQEINYHLNYSDNQKYG